VSIIRTISHVTAAILENERQGCQGSVLRDGPISKFDLNRLDYVRCANFGAFIKKCTLGLNFEGIPNGPSKNVDRRK